MEVFLAISFMTSLIIAIVSGELDSVEDPSTPPPRYSHHTPIVSGELDSVEAPHPILELCHLHTPPFQENWIVWKSSMVCVLYFDNGTYMSFRRTGDSAFKLTLNREFRKDVWTKI